MSEEPSSSNHVKTNKSTFDRLRDLQILLKKESAMKELCKILYIKNKNKYL
jgi:hypothetical protein